MIPKFLRADMARSIARQCAALATLTLLALGVEANVINGEFNNGLTGWDSDGDIVADGGGFALLENGVPDFRGLSQNFQIGGPGVLSFDFSFTTSAAGGGGTDSFAVGLLSDDFNDPFVDVIVMDDALGVVPDPFGDGWDVTYQAGPAVAGLSLLAGTSFSGRVSLQIPTLLFGDDVTLFFDLFDGFPSVLTRVGIDNVEFAPLMVAVSEPPPLALLLIAGVVVAVARGRAHSAVDRRRAHSKESRKID